MTLEEYFGDWLKVIDINELNRVVAKVTTLYQKIPIVPAYSDIFKAFTLCSEDNCKIIFLGQDPYPQRGVATGVLFGNKPDTKILSPSLRVIEESILTLCDNDIPFNSFDITMESWAKQGILMINTALTCIENKIGSHVLLWRPFISSLLKNMSNKESCIIYVLFGSQAQSFKSFINAETNHILEVKHPAYYARTGEFMPNDVFADINELMLKQYGTTIQWCAD